MQIKTKLNRGRKAAMGISLVSIGAFAVGGLATQGATGAPVSNEPAAVAQRLVEAPTVNFQASSPLHSDAAELKSVGARLIAAVPAPAGRPVVVNWDAAAAQGGDSEAGMQSVVEYNASCKWYESALGTPATPEAQNVLASIPDWPSFRGTFKAATAKKLAAELATGETAATKAHIELNCR